MAKLRLVVMASGAGSTFEALIKSQEFEVLGLVASRPNIGATNYADKYKIPKIVTKNSAELLQSLESWQPDLIVLAGYLSKIGSEVIQAYKGKMLNSHPSLLPNYGGAGMYGRRVHEAVIANAEKKTGITIHWVTENYDEGPIIAQKEIEVLKGDSAETLESRLKDIEKDFLIKTLLKLKLN